MAWSTSTVVAVSCLLLLLLAHPAHAFGAGNIASLSRIEGQNWRHGDIEDVLLTLLTARAAGGKKFSKLDVQRVYFGNWLRDYSQAIDVGTVKYVSAEAIRILLWVLGFLSFGYGTGEFEVTTERLGCYRPTEHIDNPLGYAEGDDARNYDRRLRGPVDEDRELAIDPRTGLKNYIASEDLGIDNSATFVRHTLGRCIQLGRRYSRSGDEKDLYEALRLLGTGLHCLEDYSAHSNYTELALIELGERDIWPHVGRNTEIELRGARGPVFPIITGTFGGVDFLHSVMGEISDKATQSEIQGLEDLIQQSQNEEPQKSFLQDLLDKIPGGMFGDDNANKMDEFQSQSQSASQENQDVSPLEPEEWARYLSDIHQRIYPVIEWHDNLFKQINAAIEKIPVIPGLIEKVQEQITVYVFSILAPYVLPILYQVKHELETGSSEVIESSKAVQHNVFNDDDCTDPTHSMLSKDHFSNVLNEPAGKIAQTVVKWVVPQIVDCWDNEGIDADRTLTRIIYGVLHHPALRDYGQDGGSEIRHEMFRVVEDWWNGQDSDGQDSLRHQLSREGVLNGENHKSGVHDSGHGCGKPLAIPTQTQEQSGGVLGMFGGFGGSGQESSESSIGKFAQQAMGGGFLSSIVGGIVGASAGTDEQDDSYQQSSTSEYRREGGQESYGQYTRTDYGGGQVREEYQQSSRGYGDNSGYGGYQSQGYSQSTSGYGQQSYQTSGYGGGYQQQQQHGYGGTQSYGGGYEQQQQRGYGEAQSYGRQSEQYSSGHYGGGSDRRHGSRDRGSGYGDGEEYRQRYDQDEGSDDDDDRRRHHHHHRRRRDS